MLNRKKKNKEKNKDSSADGHTMEKQHEELVSEEKTADQTEVDEQSDGKDAETLKEVRDKWLRLRAEFENYRRRTNKEKIQLISTAAEETIKALLPVLDDFDRAKKNADDENSTEVFTEGVDLVYYKLYRILHQKGLKAMETDGDVFDPELHEAITEIPAPTEEMKGKIIDTVEKGYSLNDKIIRYAKVVVGK